MKLGSCIFHLLQTILVCSCINSSFAATSMNESDKESLLAFKEQIKDDPLGALSSWNDSIHYCKWYGVTCSRRHRQRVTVLNFTSQKLGGTLSPYIGNLSFLRTITLTMNNFNGPIPQEIGRLSRLEILYLNNNSFVGRIPTNLSHCSNLRQINLIDNELTGGIPVELGSLSKLIQLSLSKNELKGGIPSSLGNLSSLVQLSLAYSLLTGNIPDDLCRIRNFKFFILSNNNLNGAVPSCLYNLTNMVVFAINDNRLHGNLPSDMGFTFPNLRELYVAANGFGGSIPLSLLNASKLEVIELSENQFTGSVPTELGTLQGLRNLGLDSNRLVDDLNFINSLTNCSFLEVISIVRNSLKGSIPNSIASLSTTITILDFRINQIYGSIPPGIGNLVNLNLVTFGHNHLTGQIPEAILTLPKLQGLDLGRNRFSGQIPDSFKKSAPLVKLELAGNRLSGRIPPSLGNCQQLSFLLLEDNNLDGEIPREIFGLTSLPLLLNLSNNALTGSLPSEVGNFINLQELDISHNKLSGEIPDTLSNCLTLVVLSMAYNFFNGTIPQSLNTLQGLQHFDLSHNNLSGEIPKQLEKLTSLAYLDLSNNDLEGPVPRSGVFANASAISLEGNTKLCGSVVGLNLTPCRIQSSKKKGRKTTIVKVVIPVIVVSLSLFLISCFFFKICRRRTSEKELSSESMDNRQYTRISYAELHKATNNFNADNLIGVGSYGSVYKGTLSHNNTVVAVKVLNLQRQGASKSFISECNALRNVRHRNLVKIITSCSSIDFHGGEFKALVFEFMAKGSLEDWLHPKQTENHDLRNLNFLQRLDIAIDIASALDYLHNHCEPAIVHCDLKPSNVLLDDDMMAHVSDFGLAKIFSDISSQSRNSSLAIKGSIGYVAPEYGTSGEVSRKGDVYSYGILLLEMFTGKRPTDDMFQDAENLHSFAKSALPEQVMNIADPTMLFEEYEHKKIDRPVRINECVVSAVGLGVACSSESPSERMDIGEVVTQLYHIKNNYHGSIIHLE